MAYSKNKNASNKKAGASNSKGDRNPLVQTSFMTLDGIVVTADIYSYDRADSNILATISLCVGGFVIRGCRLVESKKAETKGNWYLVFPSYKNANDEYKDYVYMLNKQDREGLEEAICSAYANVQEA